MAGGEGKRLRPLTDNTPKPLLKVGDKPIIEYNIDRLINVGIENIYLKNGKATVCWKIKQLCFVF